MNEGIRVHGNTILVNYKKVHAKARTPFYSREHDAGLDLISVSMRDLGDYVEHDTGVVVEIPHGHFGLLCPRSSQAKYTEILANNIGVLDSNYRSTVKVLFRKIPKRGFLGLSSWGGKKYKVGDKVAQLIILPQPKVVMLEASILSGSNRGEDGVGSSGE